MSRTRRRCALLSRVFALSTSVLRNPRRYLCDRLGVQARGVAETKWHVSRLVPGGTPRSLSGSPCPRVHPVSFLDDWHPGCMLAGGTLRDCGFAFGGFMFHEPSLTPLPLIQICGHHPPHRGVPSHPSVPLIFFGSYSAVSKKQQKDLRCGASVNRLGEGKQASDQEL